MINKINYLCTKKNNENSFIQRFKGEVKNEAR